MKKLIYDEYFLLIFLIILFVIEVFFFNLTLFQNIIIIMTVSIIDLFRKIIKGTIIRNKIKNSEKNLGEFVTVKDKGILVWNIIFISIAAFLFLNEVSRGYSITNVLEMNFTFFIVIYLSLNGMLSEYIKRKNRIILLNNGLLLPEGIYIDYNNIKYSHTVEKADLYEIKLDIKGFIFGIDFKVEKSEVDVELLLEKFKNRE